MGLLSKAIASTNPSNDGSIPAEFSALVVGFHRRNALFHCIVLSGEVRDFAEMLAGHGAECADLPGGNCLVLLPGGLDRSLFAHRLSHSAGQIVRCQLCADDVSLALEQLSSYLR